MPGCPGLPSPLLPEPMPQTYTAPPRLFMATAAYDEGADEITGKTTGRESTVRVVIDLAHVQVIKEAANYETGGAEPGYCHVQTPERFYVLSVPFETVLAAWAAYRDHADKLGRLTN